MITLFQLFTLDQWYKIYNDLIKVSNVAFTCTYILMWVWVGSFVFRNLFVGIMGMQWSEYSSNCVHGYAWFNDCVCMHIVNNFQNITAELVRQQENQDQSEELARMKEELTLELTKHDAKMQKARWAV